MKPATKILKQVRRGVQNVAYGNVLYQKILASGEVMDRLHFTLPDSWPGDAQAGLALIAGQRSMFDSPSASALRNMTVSLRNLRAVGTDAARHMAARLIEEWLEHHDFWDEIEWSPAILGDRIASWVSFYEFYGSAISPAFTARLTASLQRQWKHLVRTMPPSLTGLAGLQALRGLIYGGLNFEEGEKALGLACDLLQRQLAAEIRPDGAHISRNPSTHLHMLRYLADLRAIFKASGLEIPDALRPAIAVMLPVLKFYRHGDGGLALFHGSREETPLLIDAIITQTEGRSRILRRLADTGYERITAGRSILIADAGKPPPRMYGKTGHAGLLSFEFGQGRERLIVNCGAMESADAEWRAACAATAAHSTTTIEDTNACELLPTGGATSAAQVSVQRYEQNGTQYVDMTHDGYRPGFGITHQRHLNLSADGETLQGRDILSGAVGRNFSLRWHLHPSVQASLAQSGQAALLRTPSGSGWRLRIERGELGLEPSIYCGNGTPRRSLQLRVSGRTEKDPTELAWTLVREKK
ncbi:MAG: heparinase II/III family protein [Alphaproteobacteria bacterium]|nr:heparinase II/III family protein [Alphaproteobacteria bacterium]